MYRYYVPVKNNRNFLTKEKQNTVLAKVRIKYLSSHFIHKSQIIALCIVNFVNNQTTYNVASMKPIRKKEEKNIMHNLLATSLLGKILEILTCMLFHGMLVTMAFN